MGISHKIRDDLGVVLSRWEGLIPEADILPAYRLLHESAGWRPGLHEILDLRAADLSGVSSQALRRLASLNESVVVDKLADLRTAVIAPGDLPFGLARVYEVMTEESTEKVMVFREASEAAEWMGVDPGLIE